MEQPDARNLVETARAVLLERLLPALPEALRLEARMVASAMAIAARAVGVDDSPADAALAAAIRAGARDHDTTLLPQLRAAARARLAISDPRVLKDG